MTCHLGLRELVRSWGRLRGLGCCFGRNYGLHLTKDSCVTDLRCDGMRIKWSDQTNLNKRMFGDCASRSNFDFHGAIRSHRYLEGRLAAPGVPNFADEWQFRKLRTPFSLWLTSLEIEFRAMGRASDAPTRDLSLSNTRGQGPSKDVWSTHGDRKRGIQVRQRSINRCNTCLQKRRFPHQANAHVGTLVGHSTDLFADSGQEHFLSIDLYDHPATICVLDIAHSHASGPLNGPGDKQARSGGGRDRSEGRAQSDTRLHHRGLDQEVGRQVVEYQSSISRVSVE